MTITQLHYVLAVAKHQNFTKAAERCFVTQPTLSMQIQKLEEELDIQIFDRTKKPISLTEVGEKIVEQANNIIIEANRISDIIDQQKGYIGGKFRLGIIPTIMPTLLPMFLKTFIKHYPKVKLRIKEYTTEEIIDHLLKDNLDAAIATTPLELENIKERVLYYEPFVAYIPKHHRLHNTKPLKVEDLELDDMLLLEDGHCFRDGVINLCNAYKSNTEIKKFVLESGSIETLIKLSDEGLGMTLLPYLHTLNTKKENQLHYFKKPVPAREISIIYHNSELKIQVIEALQQVISSIIKGAIVFQDIKIISPLSKT